MIVINSYKNKAANFHDGNSAPRSWHDDSLQTQVHDVADINKIDAWCIGSHKIKTYNFNGSHKLRTIF